MTSTGPITCISISIRAKARRGIGVLACGRIVHDALDTLKMPSVVKTTGSKGLHVYVPIMRDPVQKEVWTFAKALAVELAARHPALMTAEYKVAKRPTRARAGGLQPECMGTDARVGVLGAPATPRAGLHSGYLGRDRRRCSD